MKNKRIKMTVEFDVTKPQALALQAMFEYWNSLGSMGSSRFVSFYVDGDGNFKPNCNISFSEALCPLTDELRELAIYEDDHGTRKFDFDSIAWRLSSEYKGPTKKVGRVKYTPNSTDSVEAVTDFDDYVAPLEPESTVPATFKKAEKSPFEKSALEQLSYKELVELVTEIVSEHKNEKWPKAMEDHNSGQLKRY